MPKPFVIFTMRRSGGSAFASYMARVAGLQSHLSEPFNRDRAWGTITLDFEKSQDRQVARAQIASRIDQRPSLKHCVETLPWALTEELISACTTRDYAIFVLQRANESERLMSLYLALATDAWGPEEARTIYPRIETGQITPKEVPLEAMHTRWKADRGKLGQVLLQLRNERADFGWLVLEELIRDPGEGAVHLCDAARRIGVDIGPQDHAVQLYYTKGAQGSSRIEAHVPGAKALRDWFDKRGGLS